MAVLTRVRGWLVILTLLTVASLASAQNSTVSQTRAISVTGTLQSAVTANGNGTPLIVDGYAVMTFTVNCSGCSGGTAVNFEVSEDGTNFVSQQATAIGSTTVATATASAGITVWSMPVAGFRSARTRISNYSAGTVTVTAHAVANGALPETVMGTVTATQSTASNLKVDLSGTSANATAVKVDGSAVTQPVSGTVTTTPPSNASTNVAQVAGTTTDTNSGTKSAGTLRVVLATDQPALTNKLLVTPDSVALPANQSVNESQINGVAPSMGNGANGTGVQRVTIASDSTGQITLASGAVVQANAGTNLNTSALALESGGNLATVASVVRAEDSASLDGDKGVGALGIRQSSPANASNANGDYEYFQLNNGRLWASTIFTDSSNTNFAASVSPGGALNVTSTAPISTLAVNALGKTTYRFQLAGTLGNAIASAGDALKTYDTHPVDPCLGMSADSANISQTANAVIVRGQPGRYVVLCHYEIVGADAENVSLVEGTGATCGTGTASIVGSTTAANGMNFAANSGVSAGDGTSWIARGHTQGADLCVFQSGSGRVAGVVKVAFLQ